MKKIILLTFLFLTTIEYVIPQQPWQQILIPGSWEIQGKFKSPPPEYGMILWWGWDGPMSDTVIKRDLDRIKKMGFSGVMIEAGYGMTAKYLSPEWFELVKKAVYEAKSRKMRVWIEDEGKYPSGFAGGKFSNERPDLKMQGLVVTDRTELKNGESVSKKIAQGTVSAVAVNMDNNTITTLDITSGDLSWKAPEGNWRIIQAGHKFRSSVTRSVNNPTRGKDTTASLMDYLNPLATKQFLKWTHEEYKKYIGDEFGKTFLGFMGDEPDFAYTPWTPEILNEFKKRKGYDVQPFLAALFAPQLSDEFKKVKADYWDVWSDLFRDNFFKVQSDWCLENKIEYIVHLNHEDQLSGLVKSSGDFFKNMRYVGVPGVDAIWSQIWMDHVADYPKLASSASHLYGKPRAFTESFAAYTYKPSVLQAKWVLDYQLVRGINFVQIMFMSASTPRPGAVQTSNSQNMPAPLQRPPFFLSDSFPRIAGYINRISYLLSQGMPGAKIALLYPSSSMWYGDNEAITSTLSIARQLTEKQRDFDFVDEQSLGSLLTIGKGSLMNRSGSSYNAIIVPSVTILPKAAVAMLQQYVQSGIKVIFIGKTPSLTYDKAFRDASPAENFQWALTEPENKITAKIMEVLASPDARFERDVPEIKYLHRKFKDADLYFFFNEGMEKQTLKVSLEGSGNAEIWDAFTGHVKSLKGAVHKGNTIVAPLSFGGWETKIIVISKAEAPMDFIYQ